MPGFPFPLGAGVFQGQTRQEEAEDFLFRVSGVGGFPQDPATLIRRTLQVFARGMQYASLTADKLMEQIFPNSAHLTDSLPAWEKYLRVSVRQPVTVESRWDALGQISADRSPDTRVETGQGAGRGIDTKLMLEKIVGTGNCTYRFNTMADIVAGGYDPHLIYAVAFEVPATEIINLGQVARLRKIVEVHKPIHVGAAITRPIGSGFLYDDPQSLMDRDVFRI